MSYELFENLEVWKRACQLSVDIYKHFSNCKRCRYLIEQINRASISIPSNIAEGAERGFVKELIRFLNIAKVLPQS